MIAAAKTQTLKPFEPPDVLPMLTGANVIAPVAALDWLERDVETPGINYFFRRNARVNAMIKITAETPPKIHGQSEATFAAAVDFAACAWFAALFAAVFVPCDLIACSTESPV